MMARRVFDRGRTAYPTARPRSIHVLVLAALIALSSACRTVTLNLDDRDRFTPGGRVSYEFYPGIDTRRPGTLLDLVARSTDTNDEEPVTTRSTGIKGTIAIEGEIAHVEGRDEQHLQASSPRVGSSPHDP